MKHIISRLGLLLMTLIVGCGGGTADLDIYQPDDVTLAPGESKDVTISIRRLNYDRPVDIEILNLPDGVTVKQPEIVLSGDSTEATFTLQAKAGASSVDGHEVSVLAEDQNSGIPSETIKFKVSVKKTS